MCQACLDNPHDSSTHNESPDTFHCIACGLMSRRSSMNGHFCSGSCRTSWQSSNQNTPHPLFLAEIAPITPFCADCGENDNDDPLNVASEPLTNFNGKNYCEDHFTDRAFRCEDCQTITGNDYRNDSPGGDTICDSCFNDSYFICQSCDNTTPNDDNAFDDHCGDCFSEMGFHCENCGNATLDDYRFVDDDNERSYCERCFNARQCGYFTNPQITVFSPTFDRVFSSRKYGVELESSKGNCKKNETVFSAVKDASTTGPEYVSPILQGDLGFSHIESLCNKNPQVNNSCGFHLHVDATDLIPRQVCKIANGYKKIQDFLYSIVAERRGEENGFCLPIETVYSEIRTKEALKIALYGSAGSDSDKDKYHSKRYEFLNVHSYLFRGTLEIRLHEGTFNSEHIKEWINLNLSLFSLFLSDFTVKGADGVEILAGLIAAEPRVIPLIEARLTRYGASWSLWNRAKTCRATQSNFITNQSLQPLPAESGV